MQIISWNVNGIRSAWERGLAAMLNARQADIYAIQEVRSDLPFVPAEIEGYHTYWSLCSGKRGYSGVMCASRVEPLRVWRELEHPDVVSPTIMPDTVFCEPQDEDDDLCVMLGSPQFDLEGRALTLEFDDWFLVNIYAPSPHRNPLRRAYRAEWDARMDVYLHQLRSIKPVVLCGDLNATVDERDVHHNSLSALGVDNEFITVERETLRAILDTGFVDCFRYKHPEKCNAYTWWSYKHNDRQRNHGWRLDYFIVSDQLKNKIVACEHMQHVHGSDHCPVSLQLDIVFYPSNASNEYPHLPANAPRLRQVNANLSANKRAELAERWNAIDWNKASQNVARIQADIAIAAEAHNMDEIKRCQRRIFQSLSARALAVRHVCGSANGPGVDGEMWMLPHEKMLAALYLNVSNYHAMCNRLVHIHTREGKKRKIHILTYRDRVMEMLCAMALDPVAEAWADRKSFAFRRGRTMIDMAHYVRIMFTNFPLFRADGTPVYDSDPPEWAILADVHRYYVDISQNWMLDNIPLNPHLLFEFLRAGYLFQGELFPSTKGVGVGCALSPIVANMTLDGLQNYLLRRLFPGSCEPDYAGCNLVRYCDDIIVAARSMEDAEEIRGYIAEFLAPRNLELSYTKTRIVNIREGFDFMGRHYAKDHGVVRVTPSENAVKRFEASLEETVFGHTGSQASLIAKLNKKLDGWATFHKSEDAAKAFRSIDVHLTATLLRRCRKMHPRWDIDRIRDAYWYQRSDGEWMFALRDDRSKYVRRLSDVILIGHIPQKLSVNPYLHREWIEARSDYRAIHNAVGKHRALWVRQGGKCWVCGMPFMRDQLPILDRVDGAAPGGGEHLVYVHEACRYRSVDIIETDTIPETAAETRALLESLYRETRQPDQQYLKLDNFFRDSKKREIILTFAEIEDILGAPLPAQSSYLNFWEEGGFGKIPMCWLENGYELAYVNLYECKVKFRRNYQHTSNINIPEVFLYGRVPNEVKFEVEKFLKDVRTRYGL